MYEYSNKSTSTYVLNCLLFSIGATVIANVNYAIHALKKEVNKLCIRIKNILIVTLIS